jgi:hypothetical protein
MIMEYPGVALLQRFPIAKFLGSKIIALPKVFQQRDKKNRKSTDTNKVNVIL